MLATPLPPGSVLQGPIPTAIRGPPIARELEVERLCTGHLVTAAREAFGALSELPIRRRTEDGPDAADIGALQAERLLVSTLQCPRTFSSLFAVQLASATVLSVQTCFSRHSQCCLSCLN